MDAGTLLLWVNSQCLWSLVLMPLAVSHYEATPATEYGPTETGIYDKPKIPRSDKLYSHGQQDCDMPFQEHSLPHLQRLLGSSAYKNIAINCNVNQTHQLLTALQPTKYKAYLLELPRVNLILFEDVAQYYYRYGWHNMPLIHTIISVQKLPTYGNAQQLSSCVEDCCIRSSVTVHNPRISTSTKVGTLSNSCQFESKYEYRLNPKDALRGVHLTVAIAEYFPFTTLYTVGNVLHHRGYCAEVLQGLVDRFNFTYTLVETIDGGWGSKDEKTGKWNGMIGMVIRKEADMIMAGMTISKTRSEAVDFTYPFWEEPSVIVIKPWEEKETYFYKTFTWQVWLTIFSCLITTTLIIWVFELRHLWVTKVLTKQAVLISLINVYFSTLSTMVMKDAVPIVRGRAARVLWFSFWLVSLVMTTTYTGNLVAALSTRALKLPFRTLEELAADTMYTITVSDSSVQMALMEEAKEGVFARLWTRVAQSPHNIIKDADWNDNLFRLLNGTEPLTYMGDRSTIEQLYKWRRCDWMTIPEEYLPSGFGIALPKGSPYERIISSELMSLQQLGLFKRWKNTHFLKSQCGTKDSYGTESISPTHILVVLYIMCGSLGVSFFVLCIEIIAPNVKVLRIGS